jgi:uncharacterized protein (TIGR02246 family)
MTIEATGDVTACDPIDERDPEFLELFRLWSRTLAQGVAERVSELYGPGAVLVPTVSNDLATTPRDITAYFQKLIERKRPRATTCNSQNIRYFGDTVINSGIYTFDFANTGERPRARYTFAYHRSGGRWLISAHHSSLLYSELVEGKTSLDPSF